MNKLSLEIRELVTDNSDLQSCIALRDTSKVHYDIVSDDVIRRKLHSIAPWVYPGIDGHEAGIHGCCA